MKRKDFYLFLLTGIFLVVLINFRNLFTDELKYYLPAALMMREGLIPYRDFFFPQMPLSAIFFIPTSTGGWGGLMLSRSLASVLFLLMGYILYIHTHRDRRFLLLYLFNASLLFFMPVAKSRIFISFLLTLIFLLTLRERTPRNLFLAGFLVGILTGVRYVYLLSFILFLPMNRKNMKFFIPGLITPLILPLLFFILSPGNFIFDNFIYHFLLRRNFPSPPFQKVSSILKTIFFPSNLVLLIVLFLNYKRSNLKYYIFIFLINILYYMSLTPVQFHYHAETLPLVIYLVYDFFKRMEKKIFVPVYLFYLTSIILCIYAYLPGFKEPQKYFTVKRIKEVCTLIEENMKGKGWLISELPQIPYLTGLKTPTVFRIESVIPGGPSNRRTYSPEKLELYIGLYNPEIIIVHKDQLRWINWKNKYKPIGENGGYVFLKRTTTIRN